MKELIFKQFASFKETYLLDNTTYIFIFNWNTIASTWSLTILDSSENTLVGSISLILNINLLAQYVDRGLPKGRLYIFDLSESTANIGRYDFENERKLRIIYIEENELLI